ncbi:MAG: type II secretion system protein [Azoarcus sp.]|jgi:prepilin-type N-terminal cleavage/methylation domain-containing protein
MRSLTSAFVRPPSYAGAGFTLVEMAVVLVILALLSTTLIAPISGQIEARARQETTSRLNDIEQALIGFAIIHGRLPCPSTEADPASPAYGLEQSPPCNHSSPGYLPWRTLGTEPTDAWGIPRESAGSSWRGHWRYRADAGLTDSTITAISTTQSNLQIHDHAGTPITTTSASRAAAIVFSTGPNGVGDGLNASHSAGTPVFETGEATSSFDDQLHWIGHPLLIARLAQAGRL